MAKKKAKLSKPKENIGNLDTKSIKIFKEEEEDEDEGNFVPILKTFPYKNSNYFDKTGKAEKIYKSAEKKGKKKIEKIVAKKKQLIPLDVSHYKMGFIANTFWGRAWCKHLESFSDFSNRLPRGRSYLKNGAIKHLSVEKGVINAVVKGSVNYVIEINIKTLAPQKYDFIKRKCTGKINSLLELLGGHLSNDVMDIVTQKNEGLFPLPGEMIFSCTCPDWASMCKHVACTLYGVGLYLDQYPEQLFKLRGVDHEKLIQGEALAAITSAVVQGGKRRQFVGNLKEIFDVEI